MILFVDRDVDSRDTERGMPNARYLVTGKA